MRVLVDTNILLDLMLRREPFYNDSLNLCISIINGEMEGYLAAGTVRDLHYMIRKDLPEEKTREVLFKVLALFPVLDTTGEDLRNALVSPVKDCEDAILAAAAKREKLDAIITRNTKDFRESPVPAYYPGNFLTMLDLS